MTAVICTALLLMGAPCERGGHASPASDPARGGRAIVVLVISPDLERLGVEHVRELERFAAWTCIHQHEGAWNDAGDPYWGGLQMDRGFQRSYGADVMRAHRGEGVGGMGLADSWSPAEQIIVAERAFASRGFGPWPMTRIACHV